jgi:hypothetical protein
VFKISDPESEEYGNYLSSDEIAQIVKLDDRQINEVLEWLTNKIDQNICFFNY